MSETVTTDGEQNNTDHNGAGGGTPSLRLGSVKSTRQTLARLIRAYGRGEIDERTYKAILYGASHLLSAFRLEIDSSIETRLSEIEQRLETGERD